MTTIARCSLSAEQSQLRVPPNNGLQSDALSAARA
jgi:hypothetical protein